MPFTKLIQLYGRVSALTSRNDLQNFDVCYHCSNARVFSQFFISASVVCMNSFSAFLLLLFVCSRSCGKSLKQLKYLVCISGIAGLYVVFCTELIDIGHAKKC